MDEICAFTELFCVLLLYTAKHHLSEPMLSGAITPVTFAFGTSSSIPMVPRLDPRCGSPCGLRRAHPSCPRDEKAEEEQRNATSGPRCEERRRLLLGLAGLRGTAPALGRGASVPCQAAQPQVAREEPLRRRRDRAQVTRRRCRCR